MKFTMTDEQFDAATLALAGHMNIFEDWNKQDGDHVWLWHRNKAHETLRHLQGQKRVQQLARRRG